MYNEDRYGLFWLMVRYASNSWMKCWMLGVINRWAAVQLANWDGAAPCVTGFVLRLCILE